MNVQIIPITQLRLNGKHFTGRRLFILSFTPIKSIMAVQFYKFSPEAFIFRILLRILTIWTIKLIANI